MPAEAWTRCAAALCAYLTRLCLQNAAQGRVACSSAVRVANAWARELPHISAEGRRLPHTNGRVGNPNSRHRPCPSSCTHGTPAGLPCGMPGIAELIDGAIQHAAQPARHGMSMGIGAV
ncbi:hypothetical protein FHR48_000950 [Xanthomonas arboricola]|nr:hypothetical protein [Xanthomonas cannabis]NIK63438.1 hypothetical protein [Xanthomonas cannabis]